MKQLKISFMSIWVPQASRN